MKHDACNRTDGRTGLKQFARGIREEFWRTEAALRGEWRWAR